MNYTLEIFKIGFYLFLIIGIIYLLGIFVKKNIINVQSGSHLKVIDKLYMGSKTGLFLIEVNDQIILISQTENNINKLDHWKKEDFNYDIKKIVNESSDKPQQFKKFLKKYLGRKDSDLEK